VGNPPRELEKGHVAEVQSAEDLAGQVAPAHHDAVGVRPAELGADHQSALMLASLTTLAHRCTSAFKKPLKCSGVPATTSTPVLPKRSLTSGDLSTFTISALSRCTISRGVPVTVSTPNHTETS